MYQRSTKKLLKKVFRQSGRLSIAFMAAATLFMGSMLPVFASGETTAAWEDQYYETRVFDSSIGLHTVNVTDSGSKPSSGSCIHLTEYNTATYSAPDVSSSISTAYVGALYHTPFLITVSVSGLVPGCTYNGVFGSTYALSWSFGVSGWTRNGTNVIQVFCPEIGGVEVANSGNSLTYQIRLQNYKAVRSTETFNIYVIFETSFRASNQSNASTATVLTQTATVVGLTGTRSGDGGVSGRIDENNYSDVDHANTTELLGYTLTTYASAISDSLFTNNTLLNSLLAQQVSLYNRLNVLLTNENGSVGMNTTGQLLNLIYNDMYYIRRTALPQINTLIDTDTRTIHNDLVTLHNDLTDPDPTEEAAKDNYESAAAAKESAESAFTDGWDPDKINDDYDSMLNDNNPLNSGELLQGADFWYELTNEFWASAKDEHAEYPFLIQMFFNMLGQLW